MSTERYTIASFHAHPDDEALLTSGTLARAVAEGHRVVIVVATAGEAGLAGEDIRSGLGDRRRGELADSARAIGAQRVEVLGYADSGSQPPYPTNGFCRVDPDLVAADLATILVDEQADVLTSYDPAGGYGHPDHIQVHLVAGRAAALAGTPVLLEATLDRTSLHRATRWLRIAARVVPMFTLPNLAAAYTVREDLTHRVDVRNHLDAKLASLRAHASQATGGPRTLSLLGRLPRPLQRRVLGHEWYREAGQPPQTALLDDIFASLRTTDSASGLTGTQQSG